MAASERDSDVTDLPGTAARDPESSVDREIAEPEKVQSETAEPQMDWMESPAPAILVETAEFVAAAGGAGFVMPFVKAIATKAGEDCYQALRSMIRRREPSSAGEDRVRLTDPDNGTVLVYVPPLPDEAIVKLAALKPRQIANRTVIWESSREEWEIRRKR